MRKIKKILISILILSSIVGSCKDDDPLNSQEEKPTITLVGKIEFTPMPPTTTPPLPGLLFCLKSNSKDYILTLDGHFFVSAETFTVANIEYSIEDEVEITGMVTETERTSSEKDLYIEIKTIKKRYN